MRADPLSGTIYVFRARRADRVKLVYWDGTGVCLFAKRLEDGRFRWPVVQDGVIRLTAAKLSRPAIGMVKLRALQRCGGCRSSPNQQLAFLVRNCPATFPG